MPTTTAAPKLQALLTAQAEALVRRFDRDGDRRISLAEARQPVRVPCEETGNPCVTACDWTDFTCTAALAEGALRTADLDRDGLSADEMVQAALAAGDRNRDGKVSWVERWLGDMPAVTGLFQVHQRARRADKGVCPTP
ncbi:MAG: hypothetical protein VKS61_11405 [Candidatus Sericytochromatia bacterium]|nr:hypothetical protein [Candidatus Sericytochromatia bacterium]